MIMKAQQAYPGPAALLVGEVEADSVLSLVYDP
jgi:hypothetical protein